MIARLREALGHPLWQAFLLLLLAYVIFDYGIAYLPPLVGAPSAPVPRTVLLQYMLTAVVGVLLYVSSDEARWRRFRAPLRAVLVDRDRGWIRGSLLVGVPLLAGWITYEETRPKVEAPVALRSIHPAPPGRITVHGAALQLAGLENPLRTRGALAEQLRTGRRVYYQNCVPCHGDRLDGQGHFAHGFSPAPLSFADPGTIAQLTESYVFWRVAKGGPGLPREGAPWSSAMPVWEDFLTTDEMWAVVLYLYEQTGWRPRRWETEAGHAAAGGGEARGAPPEPQRGLADATTPHPSTAPRRGRAHAALAAAGRLLPAPAPLRAQSAGAPHPGKATYDRWCAGCHGDTGAGDGEAAAYMLPHPRDFTRGVYQIRTTASGELPTDADLRHVVDEGMPGTAMPGWRERLAPAERDAVIAYVKSFSPFFARGAAPAPVAIAEAPRPSAEGIAEGRRVYEQLECFKCHGQGGRGDGQSAPTLTDDWDHPIAAADLTANWRFNGGGTVDQIYARLRTGLDGTPMPSFADAVEAGLITDAQLWRVAEYVRSLSPERPPVVREVIRAARTDGPLPSGPGDSAWAAVERHYVPLVGQVIVEPRWFAPAVDGVWVQALHDGARLALRLSWTDRSRSPDAPWDEWLGRVAAAMTDADGAVPTTQGSDRLTVQLPVATPPENDARRPYFLGGSARAPVHTWRWTSTPDTVVDGVEAGLGQFTPRGGPPELTHAAQYDRGEWRVQLTRALAARDSTRAPTFAVGRAIPIAFRVSDGSNGEDERRTAISTWYALYLDVPTPPRVLIAPALAVLLTAGGGFGLVRRAQRQAHGDAAHPNREDPR